MIRGKSWQSLFQVGIFLKLIEGILQTVSGLVILFIGKIYFISTFLSLTRSEFLEDPNDWLMNILLNSLRNVSDNTKIFISLYILAHGLINIFLAINLYREKVWAYLATVYFLIVLVVYQVYRIYHTHSLILILITLIDLVFIFIIMHKYKSSKNGSLSKKF